MSRLVLLVALTPAWGCSSGTDDQLLNGTTGSAGQAAPPTIVAGSMAVSAGSGTGLVGSAGTGTAVAMAGSPGGAGTGAAAGSTGAAGQMGVAGSAAGAPASAGSAAAAGGGAGGAGGGSGMAGASGAAGAAGSSATHEDLGKGDGKDVVTIGDSWMNLITQGIEQSLDKASGQKYRHYAVPGTLVLNEQIPNQFKQAVMANKDVKTVVMTGGGNDILTSACADEACNAIVDQVSERITKLLEEMKTAGVQDVVIIGYTYPDDMTKHASLDHSRALSATLCVPTTMPRCHAVDSTKLMITLQDGIHPNAAGDDKVAKTVFDLMVSEGMRR